MLIVFNGDNLHEMSNLVSPAKIERNIAKLSSAELAQRVVTVKKNKKCVQRTRMPPLEKLNRKLLMPDVDERTDRGNTLCPFHHSSMAGA